MCLMTMIAKWREHMKMQNDHPFDITFEVATVNHGLRSEAANECDFVVEQAQKLTFKSTVLEPPSHLNKAPQNLHRATGIQEWAREARYQALETYMHQHNIRWLMTAHTRNDQAETIMMRLSAGSSMRGLTGMKALTTRNHITLFRPFLTVSRAQIIATCHEAGIEFLDDPSNHQTHFTRVRWRSMMPMLADEGLTLKRIETFGKRCNDADEAITHYAHHLIHNARILEDNTRFDLQLWINQPFAVVCRAFELIFTSAHTFLLHEEKSDDRSYHLRLSSIEAFTQRYLRRDAPQVAPLRLTLAGMLISINARNQLHIMREKERKRGRKSRPDQPAPPV